ncbi:MAG: hypothetical protein IKP08_06765 [Bacteroidales bacterium]|nr:hypothetical protein [Bacteroidales bacterium]
MFLCIASLVAVAQEVYDTVLFDNITFNDSKLFTTESRSEEKEMMISVIMNCLG